MIRVQRKDFDVGAELAKLTEGQRGVAPGMTEKQLAEIEAEAQRR
jgi:hypothetical protein